MILSRLPMHPRLGRMLLYSVLCGCSTSAAKVVSVVASRDPFVIPMDAIQKRQAMAAKHRLSKGYRSDQLAVVSALDMFEVYRKRTGFQQLAAFCDEHFISMSSMSMLSEIVGQAIRDITDMRIASNKRYHMVFFFFLFSFYVVFVL